jgi:hypothetical protein
MPEAAPRPAADNLRFGADRPEAGSVSPLGPQKFPLPLESVAQDLFFVL